MLDLHADPPRVIAKVVVGPEGLGSVATPVRSLGHPCEQPERAIRDEAASAPDRAVWVLECANATHRVRYDNDVPAEIRQLE